MSDLLYIYALFPIVYFMYRAGEIANEKGSRPLKWKISAYFASLFGGCLLLLLSIIVFGLLLGKEVLHKPLFITLLSIFYVAGVFVAGFVLLSFFKRRKSVIIAKRTYRSFDLKNAFLFPRIIPRGGFLWRVIVYVILLKLLSAIVLITAPTLQHHPFLAIFVFVVFIACVCFALLYYISFICIPRIRDAGLSRDVLVLLFIPGISLVALVMLFATPSCISGRASI